MLELSLLVLDKRVGYGLFIYHILQNVQGNPVRK